MLQLSGDGRENIILREFQATDDEEFKEYITWLRDLETIKYIGKKDYLLTLDYDSIKSYVQNLAKSPNDSFFKVYYNKKFIGTFKVGHINWETRTADMGIMIGDISSRGKKLSTQIMKIGLKYAFEILGLWKAWGGVCQEM